MYVNDMQRVCAQLLDLSQGAGSDFSPWGHPCGHHQMCTPVLRWFYTIGSFAKIHQNQVTFAFVCRVPVTDSDSDRQLVFPQKLCLEQIIELPLVNKEGKNINPWHCILQVIDF